MGKFQKQAGEQPGLKLVKEDAAGEDATENKQLGLGFYIHAHTYMFSFSVFTGKDGK